MNPRIPQESFFKRHVLPVLFIFVIPAFAVWFFGYAEDQLDTKVYSQLEGKIRTDGSLSASDRQRILEYHQKYPVSRIMASNKPEIARLQAMFEPVKTDYAIFRWMKRIGWICLATTFATLIIVGVSVAFSLRSHAALFYALRIGWPVLRTSAAIQVIGQAILLVTLSFWVTAIFAEIYIIKLVVLGGIAAVGAVIALFGAIFARVDDTLSVEGEVVSEANAPDLWKRIREMAAQLKTAAPDQMIAGVPAGFA